MKSNIDYIEDLQDAQMKIEKFIREQSIFQADMNTLLINRSGYRAPPAALTEKEAAVYCSVSVRTLQRFRGTANAPKSFQPFGNNTVRYLAIDLDRWLLTQRNKG